MAELKNTGKQIVASTEGLDLCKLIEQEICSDKLAAEQEQQINNDQVIDFSSNKLRKTEARVEYKKRLAIEQEQN